MEFQTLTALSVLNNTVNLAWSIKPTHENLADYSFIIYRGDTEISVSGIDTLTSNNFAYTDTTISGIQFNKYTPLFYQISAFNNNTSVEYKSNIIQVGQTPLNWIALEIIRRENIVYKNSIQNKLFLLKKIVTGQYCDCYDPVLGSKSIPGDHLRCFNTTWVGGYYAPYLFYGNIGTVPRNQNESANQVTSIQVTQLNCGPFPALSPNDVIIDKNNNRWLIGNVSVPKVKMDIYRQTSTLQVADRSSLIYKIPVDISLLY